MKLAKMLKTAFLSSALLLTLASVAGAAEKAAAVDDAAPVAATAPVLASTDGNCDAAKDSPFFQVSFTKPTAAFSMQCGSCSSGGCAGGFIGQMCWTGGINGQWGNCNLYSGGYSCTDGNFECSCGYGPIP